MNELPLETTPETHSRNFKGIWIPAELWINKEFSPLDKCLIAEIESLSSPEKGCFASNQYLAEMLCVTENHINNMLTRLRKIGIVETVSFDGRHREMRVNLAYLKKGRQLDNPVEPTEKKVGSIPNFPPPDASSNVIEKRLEITDCVKTKKFVQPTLQEVKLQAEKIGLNQFEAELFFDYYGSIGWKVGGRSLMVDWHKALSGWKCRAERRGFDQSLKPPYKPIHQMTDKEILAECQR